MLLMYEGRKCIIGIMVAILVARGWHSGKRVRAPYSLGVFAARAVYKSETCFPQNSFIFKKLSLI
jgi:hypothetical protein